MLACGAPAAPGARVKGARVNSTRVHRERVHSARGKSVGRCWHAVRLQLPVLELKAHAYTVHAYTENAYTAHAYTAHAESLYASVGMRCACSSRCASTGRTACSYRELKAFSDSPVKKTQLIGLFALPLPHLYTAYTVVLHLHGSSICSTSAAACKSCAAWCTEKMHAGDAGTPALANSVAVDQRKHAGQTPEQCTGATTRAGCGLAARQRRQTA